MNEEQKFDDQTGDSQESDEAICDSHCLTFPRFAEK
jgi:hypothetical protein